MSTAVIPAPYLARRERTPGPSHGMLCRLDAVLGLPTVAAAALALLVYLWVPKSMADPDIWWHLRDAAEQWRTHGVLHHDVLSATAHGAPWINHEWLAEVPFWLGWVLAGARGVVLVTLAATEAVMLLTFLLCYRLSRSTALSLVFASLATLDATVSFGPRTLLFGWLCLNVLLLLLQRWSAGHLRARTALWAFPALFLVWGNAHGSWLIGMLLLGTFLACNALMRASESPAGARWKLSPLCHTFQWPRRRDKPLWMAAGLSLCALLVNPYGWRLVAYPFDLAFQQKLNVANVQEWQSLDFHTARAKLFLLMLFAFGGLQLLRRPRWALWEVAYVAVGVYAALAYSRFLFLAGLLVCPIVARHISLCLPPPTKTQTATRDPGGRLLLHLCLLAAMLHLAAQRFPSAAAIADDDKQAMPLDALPMLRAFHPQGVVFNQYTWGGFLEYNTPHLPTFVDSRVDIFERNGTFEDYLEITHLQHPLETLHRRNVRYVFFERDAPLVQLLQATGEWRCLYLDRTAVLLEHVP